MQVCKGSGAGATIQQQPEDAYGSQLLRGRVKRDNVSMPPSQSSCHPRSHHATLAVIMPPSH